MTRKFEAKFAIEKHYKAAADEGEEGAGEERLWIEGYASHGAADSYGDKISEAAMKQLAELMPGLTLLRNHDPDQEVGKVVEAKFVDLDDGPACWVKTWVPLSEEATVTKVQDGRLDGFSIHVIPDEWNIKMSSTEWYVTLIHWERAIELSLTSIPAQEKAVVLEHYVKNFRLSLVAEHTEKVAGLADQVAALKKSLGMGGDPEPTPEPKPAKVEGEEDPPEGEEEPPEGEEEPDDEGEEDVEFDAATEAEWLEGYADRLAALEIEDDDLRGQIDAMATEARERATAMRAAAEKAAEEGADDNQPTEEEVEAAEQRATEAEEKATEEEAKATAAEARAEEAEGKATESEEKATTSEQKAAELRLKVEGLESDLKEAKKATSNQDEDPPGAGGDEDGSALERRFRSGTKSD